MQYRDPKNYPLVLEALMKGNRQDLIGHGPKCLIRPPQRAAYNTNTNGKTSTNTRNNKPNQSKKPLKNSQKQTRKH